MRLKILHNLYFCSISKETNELVHQFMHMTLFRFFVWLVRVDFFPSRSFNVVVVVVVVRFLKKRRLHCIHRFFGRVAFLISDPFIFPLHGLLFEIWWNIQICSNKTICCFASSSISGLLLCNFVLMRPVTNECDSVKKKVSAGQEPKMFFPLLWFVLSSSFALFLSFCLSTKLFLFRLCSIYSNNGHRSLVNAHG